MPDTAPAPVPTAAARFDLLVATLYLVTFGRGEHLAVMTRGSLAALCGAVRWQDARVIEAGVDAEAATECTDCAALAEAGERWAGTHTAAREFAARA